MPPSRPAAAPPVGPTARGGDPAPRGKNRMRDALVNGATRATLRTIPLLPEPVKRALLGFRSVTVDGNTLDTTLQLLLAAQRAAGISGLVASDDVGVARRQLSITAAMLTATMTTPTVATTGKRPPPN